jgi:hypothetical protein
LLVLAAVFAWGLLYSSLERLTYGVLSMSEGARLAMAVEFFVHEAPKILMLLVVVVFGVGVLRSFFTPE